MVRLLRSAAFASVVQAAQLGAERNLVDYTFDDYRHEFGRAYDGVSVADRRAQFNANLEVIKRHNARPDKTWFASVNQFTDLSQEEFQERLRSAPGPLFGGEAAPFEAVSGPLPERVDWREQGAVTPPKDQGHCGSCWAFSAVQSLESHLALATGDAVQDLSAQQLVSCTPNPEHCGGAGGCDGATPALAFEYSKRKGLVATADSPYEAVTGTCDESKPAVGYNTGYVQLPENNYTALLAAVAGQGPISIGVAASFNFQFYGGGVLSNCNSFVMNHAVQLVGFGSEDGLDYWLVRNSWGGAWGEQGYIRIRRHGEGSEPCGQDTDPQMGEACQGDTEVRTYCGECGILASSAYPTGLRKGPPPPSPPTPPPPAPTPAPSPPPSPRPAPSPPVPGCKDEEDEEYCRDYATGDPENCQLWSAGCQQSCGCCVAAPPAYCGNAAVSV